MYKFLKKRRVIKGEHMMSKMRRKKLKVPFAREQDLDVA
jgi:hypothetical protein